jgi:hypothetical protein
VTSRFRVLLRGVLERLPLIVGAVAYRLQSSSVSHLITAFRAATDFRAVLEVLCNFTSPGRALAF